MGVVADEMVRLARQEWEFFGRSTRILTDDPANGWDVAGNERDEPYCSHITRYWRTVGRPHRNGLTPKPWSAAFISWCFVTAGADDGFRPSGSHSSYIDRIRRHDEMSPLLRLRPPSRSVAPGDLIWNSRGDDAPGDFESAILRLENGDLFLSHVDVVVDVRDGECDSIGGNVHPGEGGSVVRSTWRLDQGGALADPRKTWIGVVKNGL